MIDTWVSGKRMLIDLPQYGAPAYHARECKMSKKYELRNGSWSVWIVWSWSCLDRDTIIFCFLFFTQLKLDCKNAPTVIVRVANYNISGCSLSLLINPIKVQSRVHGPRVYIISTVMSPAPLFHLNLNLFLLHNSHLREYIRVRLLSSTSTTMLFWFFLFFPFFILNFRLNRKTRLALRLVCRNGETKKRKYACAQFFHFISYLRVSAMCTEMPQHRMNSNERN